jgi:hypothetical protein
LHDECLEIQDSFTGDVSVVCLSHDDDGRAYQGEWKPSIGTAARRYAGFSGSPAELEGAREYRDYIASRNTCYSRNSKGWKPDIRTLHQARLARSSWGPLGFQNPPNVSGSQEGFNPTLFMGEDDVADALMELGYCMQDDRGFELSHVIRSFQSDYNRVSNMLKGDCREQDIQWVRIPKGNIVADGFAGPQTFNALEIALLNERGGLPWEQAVLIVEENGHCEARERICTARENF